MMNLSRFEKRFITQYFIIAIVLLNSCIPHQNTSSVNPLSMNDKTDSIQSNVTKEERRKELYSLLGKLPDRQRPISAKLVSSEEVDELIIEKLLLDLNGLELVPAYFTKPKNSNGKLPV